MSMGLTFNPESPDAALSKVERGGAKGLSSLGQNRDAWLRIGLRVVRRRKVL